MKMTLRTAAIASSTFVCAALFSLDWSSGLSIDKAQAQRRVYIPAGYAVNAVYVNSPNLPWYAVRAYYFGGPWSGPGYSWAGWDGYAKVNGIACTPGTVVTGGDGIMYNCQ